MQNQNDIFFKWAQYTFDVTDELTTKKVNEICTKLNLGTIFEKNETSNLSNIELQWLCIKIGEHLRLNNDEITKFFLKVSQNYNFLFMAFCEIAKNQLEFFHPYLEPFTIQQHHEFPAEFPNKVLNLDLKDEIKDNIVPIQNSIQNFIWTEDNIYTFDQYLRRRVIHLERTINDLDNNSNKHIYIAKYNKPKYLKSLMNEIQNKIGLKVNLLQEQLSEMIEKQESRNEIDIKINSLKRKIKGQEIQNNVCLKLIKEIQYDIDKKINSLVKEIQAQKIQDEDNANLIIKEIQNEIDSKINSLNRKLSANILVKQELNKKIQDIEQNIEQELLNLKNHLVFTLIGVTTESDKNDKENHYKEWNFSINHGT
ncbi:45531_t:CDS:2 [Gigaspora margarita]|uniref:45531_t:CDS:1 n=1 Tax=Gigaspora margarita TaxID=4874 RepID=A0ABN7UI88_GIGMA|nr:45531_t:CDS:2 [Gigaspora margarita]